MLIISIKLHFTVHLKLNKNEHNRVSVWPFSMKCNHITDPTFKAQFEITLIKILQKVI